VKYADGLKPRQLETFWSKVTKTQSCWLWLGYVDKDGYGSHYTRVNGPTKNYRAHKLSYVLNVGEVPDGLVLDHICRVRNCVNPDHLRVVTNRVNVLAGIGITAINARKAVCKHGHEFTPENTAVDNLGKRYCRRCRMDYQRRYRANRKAAA